jgi:hypothetical protein
MAEPIPPLPPDAWSRAVVLAALDHLNQSDSHDRDDLMIGFMLECWPTPGSQSQ